MSGKIQVKVYQKPFIAQQEQLLFQKNIDGALFPSCARLFQKFFPDEKYPKERVEAKLHQLLQTVTVAKHVEISLGKNEIEWQDFLRKIGQYYPQLVWYQGFFLQREDSTVYFFNFIPLVLKEEGFPFGMNLAESLLQQDVPNEERVLEEWQKELRFLVEDLLDDRTPSEQENSSYETENDDNVAVQKKKIFYSGQEVVQTKANTENLTAENERLKVDKEELLQEISRLKLKNQHLAHNLAQVKEEPELSPDEVEDVEKLEKQMRYFEEELRREKNAKERIKLAKEKLEYEVTRIEKRLITSGIEYLENEVPYIEREKDWQKLITVGLREYDQCYQKAKYLEHIWRINRDLLTTTETLTITSSELSYERERLQKIKNSSKEIELFVMMDECQVINDRVKIKRGFLFWKPRVRISKGDYNNLTEKAAYFDVIQSENQLLEKIIQNQLEVLQKQELGMTSGN